MPTKKEERNIAAELGSRGGRKTVKRHGKKHMQEIARRGLRSRWGDKDTSTVVEPVEVPKKPRKPKKY